jgi:hypothetical protein
MFHPRNIFVLLCTFGLFPLPSCNEPQRPLGEQSEVAARPAIVSAPRPSTDSAAYVFNISALVGLTADQIRVQLGKPVSDQQESINESVKSLFYQRQGYDLLVEYNVQSHQVIRFYINPNKSTKKYQYLLEAANINQNDKRYLIEYLNGENGLYEGIVIVPDSAVLAARR